MALSSDPYRQGLKLAAAGRHAEAISSFERALSASPGDTRVLIALAGTAQSIGKVEIAKKIYIGVLEKHPGLLEAVVSLANVLRAQGDFDAAEKLLNAKRAETPDAPEVLMTLGSVYRERGDEDEAVALYRQALALRPGYAPALGNLADILADRGEFEAALGLYRRLASAAPDSRQAKFNRAFVHLAMGNLEAGWRDYAARLEMPNAPRPDHGLPRWQGKFSAGRTLLVTAEQGVGDQLMFASQFPDLSADARDAGMRLIFECDARLLPLIARTFPEVRVSPWQVETRGGNVLAHYGWLREAGGANAACEMGSLPALLRRRIADFPVRNGYLTTDGEERARWRRALSALPAPRIGICWRSGKLGGLRNRQYAPPEAWADFLRETPGSFVSAQYGAEQAEIARLEALSGRKIFQPPNLDQKDELDRTAALLAELDAVVSAPTAVSWLAAAAGTLVHKVLNVPTWTGFGTANEPFAANIVCAVPDKADDWAQAFATVRERLRRAVTDV